MILIDFSSVAETPRVLSFAPRVAPRRTPPAAGLKLKPVPLQYLKNMLMIVYITPVCYSDDMRKTVVYALIALSAIAIYLSNFLSELSLFLMIGKIPFVDIFISPTIMMIFWITIVPVIFILRHTISAIFWKIVEEIGKFNQRQINQAYYRITELREFTPFINLYTVTILAILDNPSIDDSHILQLPALRRRFIALQM